ncbi:protein crumbs homolog 3 [Dromiciops gliroides]|uniref:protein crumbs homolog 3 n=1 Tax=Dromiciops gliroides TaxID=33562 RepID=UPI001CC3DBE2|nr:protein crumbs homolog 3 [Dromiciops gliroides]XP_043832108.1 protein crumbs homolog 3 [Dromiciops gliroides]XP_043832109.1 protein crumbs homolog 3 [Dromiciops gliroides]
MASSPGLGLCLALSLQLLNPRLTLAHKIVHTRNESYTTIPSTTPPPSGALSQGAVTAIITVFSVLGILLLVVALVLLGRKLREKRQTEGTYRPSSEEQLSHAAVAAPGPQDSKNKAWGWVSCWD